MKRLSICLFAALFIASPAAADDMKKYDDNNDGKVTKQEYMNGKEEYFKKYDNNNDGALDKDEWSKMKEDAKEKMMKKKDEHKEAH